MFWNRHEPIPGSFDFTGDNDLRHFVELVRDAGLYIILRPGPFVGSGWDFGGLPAWLLQQDGVKLRTANGVFLEAVSRYFTALANQVRDLQVTGPGRGGPILLVQCESAWTCGNDDLAASYLGELNRYLREAGMSVPTINANNLWQGMEGEIDGWVGSENMLATMRQLSVVQPESPRLVIDFPIARRPVWGQGSPEALDGPRLIHRLAQILAGGGQFNISPLVSGTNFGSYAGRLADAMDAYTTTAVDPAAPVGEGGEPGPLYHFARRISTFASRFGRVLAHLDPSGSPIVQDPASLDPAPSTGKRAPKGTPRCAVVQASGTQGGVAFVFSDMPASGKGVSLLLPDGTTLPVPMGKQAAAWCLFGVTLSTRAVLDYCNVSVLGSLGDVLVCFGPAGAECILSINGSPLEVPITRGKPTIIEHESVTVVVCNEDAIDQTFITEEAVYVGVESVHADGSVTLPGGAASYVRLDAHGRRTNEHVAGGGRRGKTRVTLGDWTTATTDEYVSGESPRFAAIEGPTNLTHLGAPSGYGWYRLTFKAGAAKRIKASFPESADRLHAYLNGSLLGIVGRGPGAVDSVPLALKKGESTLVMLADNIGRLSGGYGLGEHKGLFGHAWGLKPLKAGKPTVEVASPIDVLSAFSPLWDVAKGDQTTPERLTWKFTHRRKSPLFLTITGFVGRGIVFLNDKPIHFIGRSGRELVRLERDDISRGNNTVQIALLADEPAADGDRPSLPALASELAKIVRFEEGAQCISENAQWSFARWEAPAPSGFHEPARSETVGNTGPRWWRAAFGVSDAGWPVRLDLAGMTKGLAYVNGHHLGRYFVATADRKAVGPQTSLYVPEPWLREGGDNEVMLFDEHGGNPAKVRLVAETGSPIRAGSGKA